MSIKKKNPNTEFLIYNSIPRDKFHNTIKKPYDSHWKEIAVGDKS